MRSVVQALPMAAREASPDDVVVRTRGARRMMVIAEAVGHEATPSVVVSVDLVLPGTGTEFEVVSLAALEAEDDLEIATVGPDASFDVTSVLTDLVKVKAVHADGDELEYGVVLIFS